MQRIGNLLRAAVQAVALIALFSLHSVGWARGAIPDIETTSVSYQTGTGATAGYGLTYQASCEDYFFKNGYGAGSPPTFEASPQPTACQIVWVSNGNTYLYMPTYEITNVVKTCRPNSGPVAGSTCPCFSGYEPDVAGATCVAYDDPPPPQRPQACFSKDFASPVSDGLVVANPIVPATGEKILVEEDYRDNTTHGLTFVRTYKSQRILGGNTGKPWSNLDTNWSHNFSVNLIPDGLKAKSYLVMAASSTSQ